MLFAIVNKEKILASPSLQGSCPYCESEMIPKCGQIKTWHWAHKRLIICDDWFQSETDWHRNWKLIFGKQNSEVIIYKNEQKHIADIQTQKGIVIELQNSKISSETIQIREEFYGEEMIWIINGKPYQKNFSKIIPPAIIYDDYSPKFQFYAKIHGFTPHYRPTGENKMPLRFKWNRAPQPWTYSKRKIYIDFGGENLFHVTEGIGNNYGKGYEILKLEFIKSHEGNELLISKIL